MNINNKKYKEYTQYLFIECNTVSMKIFKTDCVYYFLFDLFQYFWIHILSAFVLSLTLIILYSDHKRGLTLHRRHSNCSFLCLVDV